VVVHSIEIGGKKKTIGCCGDNCPICANGSKQFERIFVHLLDYTDGKEKVWSRTPTIIPQFNELESSWGNLSNVVFKITRKGKEFPKYDIMILPPNNYAQAESSLIDKKIGFRYYMHRSIDELKSFYSTGVMPAHETKPFVSKEEYMKQRNNNGGNSGYNKGSENKTAPVQSAVQKNVKEQVTAEDDDVFIDPFASAKPRRV
jgi:hypothetical protein